MATHRAAFPLVVLFGAAAACVGFVCPCSASDQAQAGAAARQIRIPDGFSAAMDGAVARMRAWAGTNDVVSFVVISDTHSDFTTASRDPVDWNDRKMHALLAAELARRADCDFMCDLGDLGLDRPKSEAGQRAQLVAHGSLWKDARTPHFYAMGNHDHGTSFVDGKRARDWDKGAHRAVTQALFGATLNGAAESAWPVRRLSPAKDYGTFDLVGKKCRILLLNTCEAYGYVTNGMSDEQLAFVARALEETPPGWTLLVFSHVCLNVRLGYWARNGTAEQALAHARAEPGWRTYLTTMKTLSDFVSRRPDVRLAGVFSGDSHFDNQGVSDGVPYVIYQSYGYCDGAKDPHDAARYVYFRADQTMNADITVVKLATGETRLFRAGLGGAAFDRALPPAPRPAGRLAGFPASGPDTLLK